MSTTITYKNNTLVTVENDTKILKTAGKYMEDDVTVADDTASGSAYQDKDGFVVIGDGRSSFAPQGTIIITENGTVDVSSYAGAEVNVRKGSNEDPDNWNDPIRFFDYDGTLIANYASVPNALPDIPIHDKLTNGTWNHTLEQISSQFNITGTCDIGVNYDTVSGKNEIDITLDSDHLEPWLCIAVNGTATIDWGDGSTTETITGTNFTELKYRQHVYEYAGNYTIMIDGTVRFYNSGNYFSTVLTSTNENSNRQRNRTYAKCITAVRVADGSYIGDYAFAYCYNLTSVSIPNNITSIGAYAFYNCFNLTNISIPANVTSIGDGAFYYCSSLTSISIPNGITSINDGVFNYCNGLTSISIPNSVTSIGTFAFTNCFNLTNIVIPNSVTSIGDGAFSSCFNLTSISIPNNITNISAYAFSSCYSLTSILIPNSVTSIGTFAFSSCYSLTNISIPNSVTSIDTFAFNNCYGVLEYHLLSTMPPALADKNVFTGIISGTKIYVPNRSLSTYQAATNWNTYELYMMEE